ncbi:MAG: protein-glutamate O-methyltransferase [Pseudomonadota bacterium]
MQTTVQNVPLDAASFRAIADLAYRESGLTLVEEKASMIQSRLRHRLRDLGLSDFPAYCALVTSEQGKQERQYLISALTTNVSHFFRENHHFDALKGHLAPRLEALRRGGAYRIWSAGCSNGQEALSTAITLLSLDPTLSTRDLRILATDIDAQVVQFARRGLYPKRMMNGLSEQQIVTYFGPQEHIDGEAHHRAKPMLTQMIRFNTLNLLHQWPMKRQFDIIFCRNVVIYFDLETQNMLWPRFQKMLRDDGLLFLGHSERIVHPERFGFRCIGQTTYTK